MPIAAGQGSLQIQSLIESLEEREISDRVMNKTDARDFKTAYRSEKDPQVRAPLFCHG